MDEKSVVYERQPLYDEIWAMPMREVAKRYGVSGVALAKTCRKLGVPIPGRGYWAKQKVGKAPPRPPLPALDDGVPERIVAQRWEAPAEEPPLSGLENAVPIVLAEPIVVAETLEDPHRLVALSARYLGKAEPRNGVVCAPCRSCLDICVSPASLDRALRIADALLKGLTRAQLKVEVSPIEEEQPERHGYYGLPEREPRPPRRVTRLRCDDEWISIALTERVRRTVDHGPPA